MSARKPEWLTAAMARVLEGQTCPDFSLPAAPRRLRRKAVLVDADTVQALEQLLSDARAGRMFGFAFAAMYRDRRYCVDAVGGARENLTYTRGMIAALDDVLGKRLGG
jgi:hypothetical protein